MAGAESVSPILVFAPGAALLTIFFLRFVVLRFGSPFNPKWSRDLGCILSFIAFLVLTVLYFNLIPKFTTTVGANSTPEEANAHLRFFDVPSNARNVDYRHAYLSGTVDEAHFDMKADDFLTWMAENDWEPQEFFTDEKGFQWKNENAAKEMQSYQGVTSLRTSEFYEIANGFRFDEYDEENIDSGFSIVYDKDEQRAYMWHTTF